MRSIFQRKILDGNLLFSLLGLFVVCVITSGCADSQELPFNVPAQTMLLEKDVEILETPGVMIYAALEEVEPPPGADFPKGLWMDLVEVDLINHLWS